MRLEVEAGSSLLHDITKAAARLCVLVCNPFARERWYILGGIEEDHSQLYSGLHSIGVQASEFRSVTNPAVRD